MAEKDPRFASVSSDPRFKQIPKKERKVKIDRRFEAMFKDKKFKLKYSIDKRGRPLQQTTDESLRKFYDISDSDSSDDDEYGDKNDMVEKDDVAGNCARGVSAVVDEGVRGEDKRENNDHKVGFERRRRSGREELQLLIAARRERSRSGKDRSTNNKRRPLAGTKLRSRDHINDRSSDKTLDGDDESNVSSRTDNKMTGDQTEDTVTSSDEASSDNSSDERDGQDSRRVDYSRGGAFMESSSSSEESDSDAEDLEHIDIEHRWGEMDKDARRAEDTSSRLALCNMDWDRISARDILVLLSSFKLSGGVIESVKIYISDLGLERMKDEDIHGPKELVEKDDKFEKLNNFTERKYFREKLRKYQFQRLNYYYAIIECDSVGTASYIYDQCDNYEFESSAVKLDLRFVPDDMTFDREPKEVVKSDSLDLDLYKPSEFVNSALQQSKVDLTWDEDNPERVKTTRAAFTKEELEKTDLNAYLASSSGEEEDGVRDVHDSGGEEDGLTEKEWLEKYRSLVKDLDKEDEDAEAEMEITWEPALKETTEELVSQKLAQEEDAGDKKSPWEQYQERKKEKRKEKKEKTKMEKKKMEQGGSDEEEAFSDDELPAGVDMDDPFFSQEDTKVSKKKKQKRKKNQEEVSEEDDEEELKKKAELELLMMDEDDNKQHFNLKEIMERENPKKRKKKKQRAELKTTGDDTFEVDVKDSRFDAIYSSHHFAIDPSDPHFKRTKAMNAIMGEKQTRRAKEGRKVPRSHQLNGEGTAVDANKVPGQVQVMGGGSGDVSALIKAIRRNTGNMKSKKTMKKVTS